MTPSSSSATSETTSRAQSVTPGKVSTDLGGNVDHGDAVVV
ncbi:hypothetical protein ACFYTQ_35555 [Nocardia sp. NPDC004068]